MKKGTLLIIMLIIFSIIMGFGIYAEYKLCTQGTIFSEDGGNNE